MCTSKPLPKRLFALPGTGQLWRLRRSSADSEGDARGLGEQMGGGTVLANQNLPMGSPLFFEAPEKALKNAPKFWAKYSLYAFKIPQKILKKIILENFLQSSKNAAAEPW